MRLGVNYKAAEANWDSDIAYFRSLGITCIRPNLPAVGFPWALGADTPGSLAYWIRLANYFQQAGFFVSWGISGYNGFNGSHALTAARFAEYRQIILSQAAYLQSNNITLGSFEIGNEMEGMADGTTLTVAQLISGLGTLATDVKAVYNLGTVGYSPYDFGGTTYDTWISTGKGGLDFINVHPYGNAANSFRSIIDGGWTAIPKMIKAFGADACMATEFGVEAGASALASLPAYMKEENLKKRWYFMKNLGFDRVFVYSYVGYLNGDNDFAMKKMDGSFDPMWDVLNTDAKRTAHITI